MTRYRYAVLPVAIRVALFFPSLNAMATSPSPCGSPDTKTIISENQKKPCNLSQGESLTIMKDISIDIPKGGTDGSDHYGLKHSAVNVGDNNDMAQVTSADSIENKGLLKGDSGVTVTYSGSVEKLLNRGIISGDTGAIWVSGHMGILDNHYIIKSEDNADASYSVILSHALNENNGGRGKINTIFNREGGSIAGIDVIMADLNMLNNYGILTSQKNVVGSTGGTIHVETGGHIGTLNNNGMVNGPNHAIAITDGGYLENLNNKSGSKGITAEQDAIHITGQDISGPLPKKSKINQIINDSTIHGKRYGIYIDNNGVVDTITNLDGGVIQGDNFSIRNNGTITNGIHNAGTINGNVELGSATLHLSGPNAILNGNVSGEQDSIATIGETNSLDLTYIHDMNISGGITIFSGSALRLGDGHKTGRVSNDINNEGHLYFNPSDKMAYNHEIRGKGTVHQIGSGTTILTDTNTYTGETNIESGTLQLGNNGKTGNIDNTSKVTIGQEGILAFSHSEPVKFDRDIEGKGTLHQQGAGKLILTSKVTTGKPIIVIKNTALQFGDGTKIGSLSLAGIENQGAVIVAGADDSMVTLDGEISGMGTLDITGGKAVLTSDNAYSGQTTIAQEATLQLGNGGSEGNLAQSNIFNSGMLAFNHSNNKMTYSNAISGSGSVEKNGTGLTILNGQNTYTGATTIRAGTLQFDSWTNTPRPRLVDVKPEGTLALNLKNASRFDDVISGSGHINKMGAGITTFSADSAGFSGSTHVEAGTLAVDGQLGTSMLRVQSGGTVAGTGTIGTTGSTATIENGGYLVGHQGNTLTFGNDLILDNDAHVDIALGAPESSTPTLFNVHGNLTLAGTMNVTELGGFAAGEYDIFHYGGNLNNQGMVFTDTSGVSGSLFLDTSRSKKVYLINTSGKVLNYWAGGNGIWQVGGEKNWTSKAGYPKTSWRNTDQFAIFSGTPGTVQIDNSGGQVTVNGLQFSADGYTITGQPLTLENDTMGSAKIRVGTGNNKSSIANVATIEAALTGAATLETTDYGKLILTGKNTYTGNTKLTRGILQIGNGSNKGSIAGNVAIGSEGTLIFDRSDDITFGGDITGEGKLVQNGEGTLTLTNANNHTGMAEIRRGILRQGKKGAFSPTSLYTIEQQGKFDTGGFSATIAALNNSGKVLVGGDNKTVGRTLTIAGDYKGNNGTVTLSTMLGGDHSKTDKLVVKGNTSGSTHLVIKNAGGNGEATNEGIKVIDVEGKSNGTFTLSGDYSYKGEPAIVAGAYAYRLYKNSTNNSDGNWYLRSSLTSTTPNPNPNPEPIPKPPRLYQAGVSVYEAYGRVLQILNDPGSLRDRVDSYEDRLRDVSAYSNAIVDSSTDDNIGQIPHGLWERITISRGKLSPRVSTSGADAITYHMRRAQIGMGKPFYENDQGVATGRIFLQYSNIDADVGSAHGEGKISTSGYTIGTTSTWVGHNKFYLDGLAQVTYFGNDLNSKTASRQLGNNKSALGYALSLEAGQGFDLSSKWTLTPQAQLVYSSIDMDQFDDTFGTKVRFNQSRNMKLRVGATIDYRQKWHDDKSKSEKSSNFYGLFNIRQELLGRNDSVDVANVSFHSENERTWGESGVGGSYRWDDSNSFVYGQTLINTSLNNFADSYELSAKIGLQVTW